MLDAGCGVGTESIFWSILRAEVEVVGADISDRRLAVAEARQIAYERCLGKPLKARFLNQDVFKIPPYGETWNARCPAGRWTCVKSPLPLPSPT